MSSYEQSAEIVSIVYKPENVESQPPDHYARQSIQQAELVVGHGIRGDRKGGGHPQRQLNVMSAEMLTQLAAAGCDTSPGALGEQIVVRGLDVDALPAGAQIRLGARAVIRVTKPRTGCNRFEHIQGVQPDLLQGRMGIMAQVVSDGPIQVGDIVETIAGD